MNNEREAEGLRPIRKDPMAEIALTAGVTVAFHPMSYAKVLVQLGYEPLAPVSSTSIWGRPILMYPSLFKYIGHIKKTDGFLGLYRGLGARLIGGFVGSMASNHVSQHLNKVHSAAEGEIDEDKDVLEGFKRLCHDTTHEMISRCAGVIVSQPFHVIMIRSMAQFVGRETGYDSVFSSISEIYHRDGILGFFVGLTPRLLGEALTIWLANVLIHIFNNYLLPKSVQMKGTKTYSSAVCSMLVTQLTYPLNLVANVMAVNNSGLAAGGPPHMPYYLGWRDCIADLRAQNALKRGSSMFWRVYKGPTILGHDGKVRPADQVFHY